jgi:hypothetical protein
LILFDIKERIRGLWYLILKCHRKIFKLKY